MRVPRVTLVVALVAAGLIAGCGSDDGDDSTSAQADQPARGYAATEEAQRADPNIIKLKAACMELGGNLGPETRLQCAFGSKGAEFCVNGKISGAAKPLDGWRCVVNQNLKLDADAGDQAAK